MSHRLSVSFLALLLLAVLSACSALPSSTPSSVSPVVVTPESSQSVPPVSDLSVKPLLKPQTKPQPPKAATNGRFVESVSYQTPESTENIDFAFVMKDGVVQNLELPNFSSIPTSRSFQQLFMSAVKSQIIGKKLSEIGTFDRIGGASLTTPAFNQAVAKLKSQV